MTGISPGWYKDPAEPTTQRYWDGDGWVGSSLPIDATPPEGPLAAPPPVVEDVTPSGGHEPAVPAMPQAQPPAPPSWPTPGSLPPGAFPPAPPNAPSGAQLPPGYPQPPRGYPPLPPGYPPPGAYTPQFPPGQVPPGQFPPGQIPPGQFPPGQFPPGQVPPGTPIPNWPIGVPVPGVPYVLRPIPRPHGFALAPLGLRFLARMIDIVAVLLLNVVLNGWLIYQWVQETSGYWHALVNAAKGDQLPKMSSRGAMLETVITLLAIAIWIAYEVPFIANGGQTLGKRIMGIRVVPLEGMHRLGYARAMRRWTALGLPMVFWLVSGYFIFIGLMFQFMASLSPALNRPLHLALHDRSAGTIVVEATKTGGDNDEAKEPATVGADRNSPDGGTK